MTAIDVLVWFTIVASALGFLRRGGGYFKPTALYIAGLALVSPAASAAVGPAMYRAAGVSHMEFAAGDALLILSAYSGVAALLDGLATTPAQRQAWLDRMAKPAVAAAIPTELVSAYASDAMRQSAEINNVGVVRADLLLVCYWLAVCSSICYLAALRFAAVSKFRMQPGQRATVTIFQASMLSACAACVVQMWSAISGRPAGPHDIIAWTLLCGWGLLRTTAHLHTTVRGRNWGLP